MRWTPVCAWAPASPWRRASRCRAAEEGLGVRRRLDVLASGLPGIVNAVYNGHDFTLCVLDNATTAMTQPAASGTGVTLMGERRKPVSIEAVLKAVGFECIVHADPLNLQQSIDAAREAIDFEGSSAIMFESPCVQLFKPAAPVVLDAQRCTGCKKCITEIGCPGIGFDTDARGPKAGSVVRRSSTPASATGAGCARQCARLTASPWSMPHPPRTRRRSLAC